MNPKVLRVVVPIALVLGILAVAAGSVVWQTLVSSGKSRIAGELPLTPSIELRAAAFFETADGAVALLQDGFRVDGRSRHRFTVVDLESGKIVEREAFAPPGMTALAGQELHYRGQTGDHAWFEGTGIGLHARAPRTAKVALEGHAAEAEKPPGLATGSKAGLRVRAGSATLADGTQVSVAERRVAITPPGAKTASSRLKRAADLLLDGRTGAPLEAAGPPSIFLAHKTKNEGVLEVTRLGLDGEEVWSRRSKHLVKESKDGRGPRIVGAALIDGAVVLAYAGGLLGKPARKACHVIALDAATGKVRWKRTL